MGPREELIAAAARGASRGAPCRSMNERLAYDLLCSTRCWLNEAGSAVIETNTADVGGSVFPLRSAMSAHSHIRRSAICDLPRRIARPYGRRKKRATAHLAIDFEINRIRRRAAGDYWVVLDTSSKPHCLVRVTDVDVRHFDEVEPSLAAREGEGDSSLDYWAKVHREYFQQQCAAWGVAWSETLPRRARELS